MNFADWRKKRDKAPVQDPASMTVQGILNSYQGLCYVHVADVALDRQDRFWLRRAGLYVDKPSLRDIWSDWLPVSGFSHGGKAHIESDCNWGKIRVIDSPDESEWARIYTTGD